MRKFVLLIGLTALFSACTKEYIENVNLNTYSKYFTVESADWEIGYDKLGYLYFYYTFEEPQLTRKVINNGSLNAYLFYEIDQLDTFSPLPYSDFIIRNGNQMQEQMTVEFQQGWITFILKSSAHAYQSPAYLNYTFLVRFVW